MSLSKVFRELKQQRRDDSSEKIAKKNGFESFQTFLCLFAPAQFVNCKRFFL